MRSVPTLHIRNVPAEVYDALRRRAERSRRSLNAEVVETLRASVDAERDTADLMERLDRFRREFVLPEGAPKPEHVIREARDKRAKEIERRARGR